MTFAASVSFHHALALALAARGVALNSICPPDDSLAQRVLVEYGAIFVAAPEVTTPPVCVFETEEQVTNFQRSVRCAEARIAGAEIRLQQRALEDLLRARAAARGEGLDVTPRDGSEAARRTFADGLRLWNSRFFPALAHWIDQGRLTEADAAQLQSLAPREQALAVLELEVEGMFFSKDFSKPVLQSIAAPGTSQHLALLAFDAVEFNNERVRLILARYGWFQTVVSDLPHFTYLGHDERDLPAVGLQKVVAHERAFWVPNIELAA